MSQFVQILTASPSFGELWQSLDEQGRYELDERAAIYEYEAGFSRAEAEAKAAAEFQQTESEVV